MAEYIGIEAIRKDATRLGELLRASHNGQAKAGDATEVGRLTTRLFMQMIKSDASAWVFDDILACVASSDAPNLTADAETEKDVHGLFGIGHSERGL